MQDAFDGPAAGRIPASPVAVNPAAAADADQQAREELATLRGRIAGRAGLAAITAGAAVAAWLALRGRPRR
jgi:hypothetical protein